MNEVELLNIENKLKLGVQLNYKELKSLINLIEEYKDFRYKKDLYSRKFNDLKEANKLLIERYIDKRDIQNSITYIDILIGGGYFEEKTH